MHRVTEPATPSGTQRPRNRSQRQIDESVELKAEIVRTAACAFAERGYTPTTLDTVARLVGLSRQGLLHHFASKEALFVAVLDQEREWATRRAAVGGSGSGPEALRDLVAFLGGPDGSRIPLQLIHVLEGEGIAGNEVAARYVTERAAQVRGEIRRRLQHGRDAGLIAADADLEAVTVLIAATVNGLQKTWLLDQEQPTTISFELLMSLLQPYLSGSFTAA